MINQLYDQLEIPEKCYLGKKVFKKLFYENSKLSVTDKKAFTDGIEEIIWVYSLKPETINIGIYQDEKREYLEVALLQVNLKKPSRIKRLAEIIHRAIPYPLWLVFVDQDMVSFSIGQKRINKADKEKITVENFWETNWINLSNLTKIEESFLKSCVITNFSYVNFCEFYKDLEDRIIACNSAKHSGIFKVKKDDRRALLSQIHELEQKQIELKAKLKQEEQLNREMELIGKIKSLEQEQQSLITEL